VTAATQPTGTVTLVFSDIEGSTRLLRELGIDAYRDALAEHRRIVREAYARYAGYEVDYEGDAFFYAFSSAQDAVSAVGDAMGGLESGPIRIRVGVHTGVPALDPPKYVGMDVHFAARVMSSAHGGQVVLSKATADLVDRDLLDLGEHRLKDIAEAVSLFQLGDGSFPPLKTISNTNLPRPASSFLGREGELEEVFSHIEHGARLLTLTGPGGTGKTRLALEAASFLVGRFKAGVFWVGIASLRDPALVSETIAQVLGAKDDLAAHIAEREMLLLLDNLEQVIEAAPELSQLVERCPNLTLLVTSRELLRVRGEVEYPVPPLAQPEAVSLFCDRARLEATDEIAELCARLDSLPLAVELAAARAKALTPVQILERLSGRLDLLKGGRDADPRQQTLRATIEWSYELLPGDEQRLFARLSVFAGGCTLEAAETVCDADLDTIQSLVEKSLLRFSGGRYWMLETIGEYAGERLDAPSSAVELRQRHVRWFLEFAEKAEMTSRSGDRELWFDRLEADLGNIRAALDAARRSGENDVVLRLATAMWRFWADRGHVTEGLMTLESALGQSAEESPRAVLGRCYLSHLAAGADYRVLRSEVEAVEAASERGGDTFTQVQALSLLGMYEGTLGNWTPAEDALERARALAAGQYPAEEGEVVAWLLVGALYGALPSDEGIARCKAAHESAPTNRTVRAFALLERAPLEAMRGEFEIALDLLAAGREILRELDLKVFAANSAQEAYFVQMLANDPAAAVADLRSACELLDEMGERGFLSTVAGYLAHAYFAVGDLDGARRYSSVCATAASADDLISQCLWRGVQGKLLAREGDASRAERHARDAVELVAPTDFVNQQGDRLADLAEVLNLGGRRGEARAALAGALERYERKGNLVAAERTRVALASG
jgi:predicted ATPase